MRSYILLALCVLAICVYAEEDNPFEEMEKNLEELEALDRFYTEMKRRQDSEISKQNLGSSKDDELAAEIDKLVDKLIKYNVINEDKRQEARNYFKNLISDLESFSFGGM